MEETYRFSGSVRSWSIPQLTRVDFSSQGVYPIQSRSRKPTVRVITSMKETRYVKKILLICQSIFLLFVFSSCSKDRSQVLTLGTGAIGGNYYITGQAISRIVNDNQDAYGLRLEDIYSSGSVANIDALIAGDVEFGIAQADRQYQASNGLAEWKDKGPQKELRAVFSLYTETVTVVAGRDSGVNAMQDLKGKRVDIGQPGSGTRQNAVDALDAAGIDWEKDIAVYQENFDERLNSLMHSRIDAFFDTVGHPSQGIKFATYSVRGVRFIPLANIENILSANPYYSRSFIPVGLYPQADNKLDVETIGVKATLLTSAKVPENIVYAVTKAVFQNLESLRRYAPLMKGVREESMLDGLTAPIHPGALKYYKEIGLTIPSPRPAESEAGARSTR
jgi:uncharacterized protein